MKTNPYIITDKMSNTELAKLLNAHNHNLAGLTVRHVNSGAFYRITHCSFQNHQGITELAVNYHPFDETSNQNIEDVCHTRPFFEFFDGRFTFPNKKLYKEWCMMKQTKIISGFPGIGKSTLFETERNLLISDSDSSSFSWLEPGVRHPNFPSNYITHIKENIGKLDFILVSSHDVVREALNEEGIPYTIVYPSTDIKDEYIQRYIDRGNNDGFVKLLQANFESFIEGIEKETGPKLVPLNAGQYLSDVLDQI